MDQPVTPREGQLLLVAVSAAFERLQKSARLTAGRSLTAFDGRVLLDPALLRGTLEGQLGDAVTRVRVTGTPDRRLVFPQRPDGQWCAADLSEMPHTTRSWPAWTGEHLELADPDSRLSEARLSDEGVRRLSEPRVLLVAPLKGVEYP